MPSYDLSLTIALMEECARDAAEAMLSDDMQKLTAAVGIFNTYCVVMESQFLDETLAKKLDEVFARMQTICRLNTSENRGVQKQQIIC